MLQKERSSSSLGEVAMHRIKVKDLDGLRRVLEDVKLMEPIYSRFLSKPIVQARLGMYAHRDGARVDGEDSRMWVFVSVVNNRFECYDVALWKILRYARMHPTIGARLEKYLEIE